MEAFGDADRRDNMTQSTNIFRVLIKTLLKAGIITERTRPVYAGWVDMEDLVLRFCKILAHVGKILHPRFRNPSVKRAHRQKTTQKSEHPK